MAVMSNCWTVTCVVQQGAALFCTEELGLWWLEGLCCGIEITHLIFPVINDILYRK